ncbi:hypothetical protein Pint_30105 [Pistacia integerrima]|uniref:Uncharacterized protein n=1 Tax=Pistacia integerrima TaxID=434235 RepID=A0ACC0X2H9_9ROSI|nr:hypothetical protein Pint_30105 [Pistacia integerrima]
MTKAVAFLLLLVYILSLSEAKSIVPQPHAQRSFKINATQDAGKCSYSVSIKTSCSSTKYTRDHVSLAFGDAYGNQVYAARLDDPYSGTFERSGYDGWKPETVTVYGYYTKSVTFYYNTWIPNGIWYGFDECHGASASS